MTNKNLIYRTILSLILVLSMTSAIPSARAATLDEQLKQKQQELQQAQAAAANKAQEAKTLGSQINGLETNITQTEKSIQDTGTQIDEKQGSITGLSSDIETKKKELADLKTKLNNAIVEVYRSSDRSDLELLFGSGSLSESANQSKYIESIQMQVKIMFEKVKTIKSDLEKKKSDEEAKKAELDQLKDQQVSYKKGVEYQKKQKDKLLGMTIDQKQQYEANATKLQQEVARISADIYNQRKTARKGKESISGGSSGYPYGSAGLVDDWYFITGQCTSYVAWYWNGKLGKSWTNTRPGSGSAYNWSNLARDQGYSVSSSPRVGAIVSWTGPLFSGDVWGHVAIVEGVNSDGTVDISEMNWIAANTYSYRKNVNPGDYGSYSYIY